MSCAGGQYYALFYLAVVSVAYGIYVWRGGSSIVAPAIYIGLAQWFAFNLLHDSCFWHPLSNLMVDTMLLWYAYRQFKRLNRSYLYRVIICVMFARIAWHTTWGFGIVDGYWYAAGNNALYFAMVVFTIGVTIRESVGQNAD